jgi:hypothetical protein
VEYKPLTKIGVKWIFDVRFSGYELMTPGSLRYAPFAPIFLEYELYAPRKKEKTLKVIE